MTFFSSFRKYAFRLILCVGIAILLKWGVLAGYTIPTSSMEPLLRGDPEHGDKVAVFKLQYKLFQPSRFDLVVFFKEGEFTLKPGLFERSGGINFVKRLVGFPGDSLLIRDGDLFIGQNRGEIGPSPDRKPLEVIRSILIPVFRAHFDENLQRVWKGDWAKEGGPGFLLEKGTLLGDARSGSGPCLKELRYAPERKVVFDDYLLPDGERRRGRHPVRDLALKLEVEFLADQGELRGRLREVKDDFRFILRSRGAGGGGSVSGSLPDFPTRTISSETFSGFLPGETYRIAFMNIDDRILLVVDDEPILEFPYSQNTVVLNPRPENCPSFGVKDGIVRFHDIRIDRDIYYTTDLGKYAVKTPYDVRSGCYFFLGDNSAESQDSRFFGAIPERDLVGRPFMIFYPFSRIRFF